MGSSEPKISVEYSQDATIVVLTEEKILEQADVTALEDSIMPLVEQAEKIKLVIDFSNVKFLTSSVLGLLIRISKKVYEAHGQLKLCYIDRKILEIFRITRLDKVFEIYPARRKALEGLL